MKNMDINALILDMDGVLWRSYQPIGDLPYIFNTLIRKGIKYCFATNNSSKTIDTYQKILKDFDIPIVREQIFTSGKVTAELLAERHPEGGNVYVVGMPGLEETLAEYGFSASADSPVAVVAGIDYGITYEKLEQAALLIQTGVPFIGTNPDKTFPTPKGQMPGAGAIQAAIIATTGKEPLIIGKPQPTIFQNALMYLQEKPKNVVVVGDRLETDIAGGQAADCRTALTLSGVTNLSQAQIWKPSPDFIVEDLTALVESL